MTIIIIIIICYLYDNIIILSIVITFILLRHKREG